MPLGRRTFLISGLGVIAAGSAFAFWDRGHVDGDTAFYSNDGIALDGQDVVAYFTDGAPSDGSADFTHDWAGSTWQFASAVNRDAFAADPAAYAPQYGGYCAWAVAANGSLAATNPSNWAVVDGKLYLNFNDEVQDRWNADIPGFIAEGDRRWPEVQQQIG